MSSSLPTHIYYDLSYTNNNTNGSTDPVVLTLSDTRSSSFVQSCEDYFASIVRFSIMTPSLPVFIPQVQLGQSDVNKLAYSVTLSCNGQTVTTPITYVCYDLTQPTPAPPLVNQDLSSYYYFIYSYQQWLKMINDALSVCFEALKIKNPALPSTKPPYFELDPYALVFILNADQLGYDMVANPSTCINFTCNGAFNTLMSNFQFKTLTNPTNPDTPYQFMIYTSPNSSNLLSGTITYMQMYQETNGSSCILNPVESIVLTTGILPINNSNIGLPKIFNNQGQLISVGNNSNISPIISDFQIEFNALNTYRNQIQYTPSGEYRLIDLFGAVPISNIQIGVLWKDIYGNFRNFNLNAGCSANMKLMFRRRDYFMGGK
jgi:hypothetical protein